MIYLVKDLKHWLIQMLDSALHPPGLRRHAYPCTRCWMAFKSLASLSWHEAEFHWDLLECEHCLDAPAERSYETEFGPSPICDRCWDEGVEGGILPY